MKKLLAYLLLTVWITGSAFSQQNSARLIIRGDDMGYSHAGNEALIKASKEGIQTSIEVIVPSPWFPEAVKMLNENPTIDVGIHLAITSEWDNVKWRPLSDCPSLKDPDGYFYPMIWPNKNYPGLAVKENPWKLEDIEKEFRAQIELALKKMPRISHVSAHMGCSRIDESVVALTKRLVREYNIGIDMEALGVKGIGYDGPHKTLEEKIQSFTKMLDKLEPGKTYLFVDHPGLDSPELRAIHHIGYEDVATDRQGVTSLWTSPQIKDAIAKRGILLISYKDLIAK
jgi:chitin disaccharide deacetylase